MLYVGYEHIRLALDLQVLPTKRPAQVRPVTRIELNSDHLAVPRHVAPPGSDTLEHLLFALKHEGINLAVISEAVGHISAKSISAALWAAPNGSYIRQAAFFWETFNEMSLSDAPAVGGPVVDIFSKSKYLTGKSVRNARWRVNWNGLGSTKYCPTVERSAEIEAAIASSILERTNQLAAEMGRGMLDRSLSWAYLSETEGSFAIEKETPSEDKARRFVELLREAHHKTELTEDYLVDLQGATLSNPLDRAFAFRDKQNWLRSGGSGSLSVTYVPPEPDLSLELMDELMSMANEIPRQIDPIVAGAVISFGFVFIHPFMDGNGRLSRFLFHQALCRSGQLGDGLLLPISVAMKRNEEAYLKTLTSYSAEVRKLWSVKDTGDGSFDCSFNGSRTVYRFWDATTCVEFGFRMAEQALERDLRQETELLSDFDRVKKKVETDFDVSNNELATLIMNAYQHAGTISKRLRSKFESRVKSQVMDAVEEEMRAAFSDRAKANSQANSDEIGSQTDSIKQSDGEPAPARPRG